MRRFSRILLVSLVAALAPVGVASAQSSGDDGVHVDPNSPSGREYDIPVQKARRQSNAKKQSGSTAAGASNSGSGSSGSGLFGEGVQSDDSSDGSTTSTGTTTTPSDKKSSTSTTTTPTTSTEAQTATAPPTTTDSSGDPAAAVAAADQGTGSSGPAMAFGVGGIVLLLAGLGGWLLKRRAL